MSSNANTDKIELVQLVEIDQSGSASLGEIIELYSSDDEEGGVPNTSSADIIQIDCTDQAFADLLRLNVGVTVTPPIIPTARLVSTSNTNQVIRQFGNVAQAGGQQANQVAVMNSQNLLEMLAACTNGLVTTDNPPPPPSATYSLAKEEKQVALVKPIVAPKPPRKLVCLNLDCQKSCPKMSKAGLVDLYYFGFPKASKNKRICDSCTEIVQEYKKKMAEALEQGESIFTVPTPHRTGGDVIVIDDDDEITGSSESEAEEEITYLVPENYDELIDGIVSKMDLKEQKQLCVKYLQEKLDDQINAIAEAEITCKKLEAEILEKKRIMSLHSHQKYMRTMLRPVEIDTYGNLKVIQNEDMSSLRASKSAPVQCNYDLVNQQSPSSTVFLLMKPNPPPVGVPYTTKRKQVMAPVKTDETDDIVTLGSYARPKLELSPTPEPFPRVMPKIGDSVYGMKYTAKNYWLPGTIIDTRKNIFNALEFKVQFETTLKGRPLPPDTEVDPKDKIVSVKSMSPKHIAYNRPCPFVLPVGTRVIARFKMEANSRADGVGFYFAGVIAEQPRNINAYRYLIFFDDGYAQYVGQHDVLLVGEASKEVWLDVHPDSQDFIHGYLSTYPEKAMLRLSKGSQVSMELNGAWYSTKVVDVDASLVKVQFEKIKRVEWVYRGSSRLYPIFMKYRRQGKPSTSLAIRRNEGKIPIEYPDDDVVMTLNKGEYMAKKRTALPPPPTAESLASMKGIQPPKPPSILLNTANLPEFEGKLMKVKLPPRAGPHLFDGHECGPNCVENFDPSLADLQKYTPLLIPMYYNWYREIGKYPKRHVYYRAPCGARLRDYNELEEFLNKTKCNMGIEYFCYDLAVHPYAEFIATNHMYNIKDLSYGKENVPIQCINSIDHDYPDFVQYTSTRLPGKGVTINLDDDFLSCCDCTDNCLDKEKCSCWKLTMEGMKFKPPHADHHEIGYQQRRLHEHVISGIYECNSKCKCRSTCSNRVAQNPLKWKLQVFKTSTKGWGVRPLNDIPTGSFICAYAGQLLNEISANEDGKTQGDEYLAELDYIEVIEGFKEGYEAEVVDPELDTKQKGRNDPDFKPDSDEEMDDGISKKTCPNGESSDEENLGIRRPSRFNPTMDAMKLAEKKYKPTRQYFGEEELCYIMDAKTIGNIGRYLNHSCEPNVFVQNVFVDTHDLRFPWVCFFAYKYIRAGMEMTWDYNYDIGSVPDISGPKYEFLDLASGKYSLQNKARLSSKPWLIVKENEQDDEHDEEGELKYEEGEGLFEDGKLNYEEGEGLFEDGKLKYEEGEGLFEEGEGLFEEGEGLFEEGKLKYEEGEGLFEDGKLKYEEGEGLFEDGKLKYEASEGLFEEGKLKYEEGELKYEEGEGLFEEGKLEYEEGEGLFEEGKLKYEDGEGLFEEGKLKYEEGEGLFEESELKYEASEGLFEEGELKYEASEGLFEESELKYEEAEVVDLVSDVGDRIMENEWDSSEYEELEEIHENDPDHPDYGKIILDLE